MLRFTDAQKMAKKYPDTFEAPTKAALAGIQRGDSVKVSHKNERLWVTVTRVTKEGVIAGMVDNDLIFKHPFRCGDSIVFEPRHVYCTYEK